MARKRTRPIKVQAAYNPEGHSICPLCWSRPSVDGRYRNDAPRSRGWGLAIVEKVVKFAGKTFGYTTQLKYPCSNPNCLGEIVVEWLPAMTGTQGHAHLYPKQQLKGEDADRYTAGHTKRQGLWLGESRPVEIPVTEENIKEFRRRMKDEPGFFASLSTAQRNDIVRLSTKAVEPTKPRRTKDTSGSKNTKTAAKAPAGTGKVAARKGATKAKAVKVAEPKKAPPKKVTPKAAKPTKAKKPATKSRARKSA